MGKKVALVVGSASDLPYLDGAKEILEEFGVPYDIRVLSAHRTPVETAGFASTAEARGYAVIIACAGMAAHLPGVIASHTTLPVIGVPLPAGDLKGLDALFSIVQMPSGVPVACMAIGASGAKNAALFAIQILAGTQPPLRSRLRAFRKRLGAQGRPTASSTPTEERR